MSPHQIEEAAVFRDFGMSWDKIAEQFKTTEKEVIEQVYRAKTNHEEKYSDRLGADHVEEMAELFSRGHPTRSIGEKFGVSGETARRRLSEIGVDLGGKGRKLQISTEYVEMARKMRAEGHEWIAVSEKIGFSIRQLQRHLQLTR